jgi:hypothetical protein
MKMLKTSAVVLAGPWGITFLNPNDDPRKQQGGFS